jgi:transcriptional regulator with XRE-family HTH domain
MEKIHVPIDFNAVTRRIEKEMKGYKRSAWAEKVGVTINVVSNIHGASSKQNPSLKYILAVSVATGKPMDYYLWGWDLNKLPDPQVHMIRESVSPYSSDSGIPAARDLQMGRRFRYWRQDMGFTIVEVAKRSALPVDLITRIEAGYHTTSDVIVKLAETLRCSTDYLLGCGGGMVSQPLKAKK